MLPPGEKKEEKPETDWGEVYTFFLTNTNTTIENIPKLTYPQLKIVMSKAGKYISPKFGIPSVGISGSSGQQTANSPESERTIEETARFVSLFQGIG